MQGVISRRGLMLVLSSPSGAGKTSISRGLLATDANLALSISATTRARRPSEIDGHDYHFLSEAEFKTRIDAGHFLEHARVFDHYYGTLRQQVEDALSTGRDVLFDIDWQGTQQLAEVAGADLVSIFILPPSIAELESRLHTRAQDTADVVAKRMAKSADEMSHYPEYDYVIVNYNLGDSITKVTAILAAERLRRTRQFGLTEFVDGLRGDALN